VQQPEEGRDGRHLRLLTGQAAVPSGRDDATSDVTAAVAAALSRAAARWPAAAPSWSLCAPGPRAVTVAVGMPVLGEVLDALLQEVALHAGPPGGLAVHVETAEGEVRVRLEVASAGAARPRRPADRSRWGHLPLTVEDGPSGPVLVLQPAPAGPQPPERRAR